MTACSFLPAATQMIYNMHLQHYLQGVTFETLFTAPLHLQHKYQSFFEPVPAHV